MKKHLTTLMAITAALAVPCTVMAQDAAPQITASDIFGSSAEPVAEAPAAQSSNADVNAEESTSENTSNAENTAAPAAASAADNTTATADEAPVAQNETAPAGEAPVAQDEPAPVAEASNDAIVADGNSKVEASDDSKDAAKDAEVAKDDDKDEKRWGVGAGVSFDLGLGAFTKHEYARRIRSRFAMEISGFYTIPVIDVSVHASTGFSQWMSKAGGTNGQYEFRWADSSLGLSRNIWAYNSGEFSVSFDADVSFTLPTSKASINAKLYTQIIPSIAITLKFSKLSFAYQIQYGHNFNKYTSVTYDPNEVDALSRSTGVELIGSHNVAAGGVLTEIELANMFALGYQFIKPLGLSVAFGFGDGWSYDNGTITKDDALVAPLAKVGRNHSQFSLGSVALTYTPIKYLTLSLSMVSMQPWKTADNKTIRFPWFDTVSPSKNFTRFIFGATFQY